jgi:hypothetical protein
LITHTLQQQVCCPVAGALHQTHTQTLLWLNHVHGHLSEACSSTMQIHLLYCCCLRVLKSPNQYP